MAFSQPPEVEAAYRIVFSRRQPVDGVPRPPSGPPAALAGPAAAAGPARKVPQKRKHAYLRIISERGDTGSDLEDFIVAREDRDYGELLRRGGHLAWGGPSRRPRADTGHNA